VGGKDLVADILPPPEYIIESYLTVLQSLHEADPARLSSLADKFHKLKVEYLARHEYWKNNLVDGKTKQLLLSDSYAPALDFFDIAEKEFFPLLLRGDSKSASALAQGRLKTRYEAHRGVIDEIVKVTNERNAALEGGARRSLTSALLLLVAISLGACVIGLLVLAGINRGIFGAFRMCLGVTNSIAAGDLSVDIRVEGTGILRELLQSLDKMLANLRDIIGKVTDVSHNLASASRQLSETSEQIATGAEEVAAQAATVATASEEMSATSTDIARNCVSAAQVSEQSIDFSYTGAKVFHETISGMGVIADLVDRTSRTVESLGSRSEQIGAIVGTIEDIADQTNLLALNAAIEAARAGEQGRGFAVVADEVRALAERTTKATREIGEMIKAIQNDTGEAVRAMEEGVREAKKGEASAGKSGEALSDIITRIGDVAMQINQIAAAAEQQTATTGEVTSNIHQITEVVNQTARGAEETAVAAAQLAHHAGELQSLVGRFTLERVN
jgi:methyl-accepting chemotaxis protein